MRTLTGDCASWQHLAAIRNSSTRSEPHFCGAPDRTKRRQALYGKGKMKTSGNAQFLVKYRLHCLWVGRYTPEPEVERIAAWMFPAGCPLDNPDPAKFSPSEIEILRRMTDNMV